MSDQWTLWARPTDPGIGVWELCWESTLVNVERCEVVHLAERPDDETLILPPGETPAVCHGEGFFRE